MTDEISTEEGPMSVGGSCLSIGPMFCDNLSMWGRIEGNIDTSGMIATTLEEMPAYICPYQEGASYYYDPSDETFCAHLDDGCDAVWNQYKCPDEECQGLVQPSDDPPVQPTSGGMKWYHFAVLGALGAGAGYMLFKDRGRGPMAAAVGGGAAVLAVAAFRPGGWLRKSETAGVRR